MHPMKKKRRLIFFLNMNDKINTWQNVILIGDFNTVFSELDLGSKMVFRAEKGREELVMVKVMKVMKESNLIDVWRERNRTKRKFSRAQVVMNQLKQSRIDYVLCNGEMEGNIKSVYYKEVGLSDHFFLRVEIDFTRIERGKGVWVLNAEILKDESYKGKIKQILENSKMNKMYEEEKRIWWDNVKWDKECFNTTLYFFKKSKNMKEMEIRKELEKETQRIEGNEKEDLGKMLKLQDQLREIEYEKCKGEWE